MAKCQKAKPALALLLCIATCVPILWGCQASTQHAQMTPLTVSLLKVGKADAIVLATEGHAMVIDAGEEDDGDELVAFLKEQGIQRVDTLVITHFDRDHVGGADTLVEEMEIGQVLLPAYQGSSTDYLDFMEAMKQKGLNAQELSAPLEFQWMQTTVLVEPPLSYERSDTAAEMDNNFSLITTVVHGDNRLLFAGDAEKQRIRQWVSGGTGQACDFLKMPHHGVYNKALDELLDAVAPQYAVICSSNKHPADAQTLELLKQKEIAAYQTKDGNVTVISNGSRLELHQELKQ
ncbi:MAG: MBL fold metallo-hydrolase [Oscillospiraceae bacterium]